LRTTTSKTKKRKSSSGFDLKPSIIVVGLFLLAISIIILTFLNYSNKRLIPISIFALIAGIVYENRRLSEKWSTTIYSGLFSFILSFFSFCPGKHEIEYNLENHIQIWIYSFIFFFVFLGVVFNKEKIIPKLTEGITLLQSIAVAYWIIDFGIIYSNNIFIIFLLVVALLFSMYSAYNAFSYVALSTLSRFVLSIWSSIVMVLFAVDNIYSVYQNEQIEDTAILSQGLLIGLQYFLLGVCSIYIVQNFMMLVGFLPGKGTFFNDKYFKDVVNLKNEHIARYSDIQVNKLYSLFCLLFVGTVFSLNYYFKLLPRNTSIWLVFVIFPYIILIYDYLRNLKKTNITK
jgi:hypothetical protein